MIRTLTLVALLGAAAHATYAQPGALDPSFGENDLGFGFGDGASSSVNEAAVRTDGLIAVVGGFGLYDGIDCNLATCLGDDGHPAAGFQQTSSMGNNIEDMFLLPDDRMMVCGSFTGEVRRFLPSGAVDPTFDAGTGPEYTGYCKTINLLPDGRMIMGGDFETFDGVPRVRMVRMLPDGALDTSFDPGTGADGVVLTSAVQADGKILIGGGFTNYDGTPVNRIARLLPDGQLDATFQIGTGFDNTVNDILLQPDGRIIVCGRFTHYNGAARDYVVRLLADGTLDPSFNVGDVAGYTKSATLAPDGMLYIVGDFFEVQDVDANSVVRVFADGTLDPTFNAGLGSDTAPNGLLVLPDGKLLVFGGFLRFGNYARHSAVRLHPDGTVDPSFGEATGINGQVQTISPQPDGRVLLGGYFKGCYGALSMAKARLTEEGAPDPSFATEVLFYNTLVYCMLTRDDGTILVGGSFSGGSGLRLYGPDGIEDQVTPLELDFGDRTRAFVQQPDGKILVGGDIHEFNGTARKGILRLNADLTLDTSFDPGTGTGGTYGTVGSIALQPDGRIIIGGNFTDYNGHTTQHLARLNADGSYDPSFQPVVMASGYPMAVVVQPDGKVVVCTALTANVNGVPVGFLFRLNSDGTLDQTWQDGTGPNASVYDMVMEASGHVVIAGNFTTVNGTPRVRLARLQPDGPVDLAFQPGEGANDIVWTVELLPSGNLLIGGEFTAYDGVGRNRVARVQNDIASALPSPLSASATHARALGGDRFFIPQPTGNGTVRISISDAAGRTIATSLVPDAHDNGLAVRSPIHLSAGLYHLQVYQGTYRTSHTVVVMR